MFTNIGYILSVTYITVMADIQNTLEAYLIQDFLIIMLSRLLICLHVILFLVQNIVLIVFLKWENFQTLMSLTNHSSVNSDQQLIHHGNASKHEKSNLF